MNDYARTKQIVSIANMKSSKPTELSSAHYVTNINVREKAQATSETSVSPIRSEATDVKKDATRMFTTNASRQYQQQQ